MKYCLDLKTLEIAYNCDNLYKQKKTSCLFKIPHRFNIKNKLVLREELSIASVDITIQPGTSQNLSSH